MKKPRYYYTADVSTDTLRVKCVDGEPLYVINRIASRKLPRLTICGIWDTDTDTMSFGYAKCSCKDVFKKSIGREIAYKRATTDPFMTVKINGRRVPDVFMDTCIELDNSINFNA